jgi:hypothetical protein
VDSLPEGDFSEVEAEPDVHQVPVPWRGKKYTFKARRLAFKEKTAIEDKHTIAHRIKGVRNPTIEWKLEDIRIDKAVAMTVAVPKGFPYVDASGRLDRRFFTTPKVGDFAVAYLNALDHLDAVSEVDAEKSGKPSVEEKSKTNGSGHGTSNSSSGTSSVSTVMTSPS